MSKLVVILDLNFSESPEISGNTTAITCVASSRLRRHIPNLDNAGAIIDLESRLRNASRNAETAVSRFLAEGPAKILFRELQGENFPGPEIINPNALWYLNVVSEKNYPQINLTYLYAAVTEIRKELSNLKFDSWEVYGGYPEERDVLRTSLFSGAGEFKTRDRPGWMVKLHFLVNRFRQARMWNLLRNELSSMPEPEAKPDGVLVSSMPLIWKQIGGHWQDRYYHKFPEICNDKGNYPYLFSVREESLTINSRTMSERLGKVKDILDKEKLGPNYYLERYVFPDDIKFAYLQGGNILNRYLKHFRKKIRGSFVFENIDFWPMVRKRLETSLLQLPELLLNMLAAYNFIKAHDCRKLMMYGFEFRWNRAVALGAKSAGTDVVGFQHGPFTAMKGLYSYFDSEIDDYFLALFPDVLIVDGETPAEVLTAYNKQLVSKINVLGAPRFDSLAGKLAALNERQVPETEEKLTILVTPGHTDTELVVDFAVECVRETRDLIREVIFKSHPIVGERGNRYFRQAFAEFPEIKQTVSLEDVHELIIDSDVLACTYSSCGVEALALGKPVMCLETGGKPNMSQLFDFTNYHDYISTPEQFKDFLENIEDKREEAKSLQEKIERAFFYKLDGESAERVTEFITAAE